MIDAIFAEANPGPLKAAMGLVGFPSGDALAPLQPPSPATLQRVAGVLKQLGASRAA